MLSIASRVAIHHVFMHALLYRVSKEDVEKLKEKCYEKDGIVDSIETYDFKLSSRIGRLDVRIKFNNAKPKIVVVKKFEYKVAIFDILCLNRYAHAWLWYTDRHNYYAYYEFSWNMQTARHASEFEHIRICFN